MNVTAATTGPDIIVTAKPYPYRRVTARGQAHIIGFESFRSLAYDDQQPKRTSFGNVSQVRGVPTIGFGHIDGVTKLDVVNRRKITKAEAMDLFFLDLEKKVYKPIYRILGAKVVDALDDCQYDALCGFVFNCGLDPAWTITKYLKAKRFGEVPDQMIRFVNDNGQRSQGLVNRRRVEVDMWREADTVQTGSAPASINVEIAPGKPLLQSRTFVASALAAFAGMGGAITAATESLTPYADNPAVHGLIIGFTVIGTMSGMYAAFLKMQDQMGARA
jgi:lysozyme